MTCSPPVIHKIVQILLFGGIIVFLPAIIIVFSFPFLLYRTLVIRLAKVLRKDLGSVAGTKSSIFTTDNIFESPKANVVSCFVIEGTANINTLRESVQSFFKTPLKKDLQGKVFCYQQLQQYVDQWCGYRFWKTDAKFDPVKHLKSLPDEKKHNEEDLKATVQSYIGRKWSPTRPMWKLILIPNFTPTNSETSGINFIFM